MRVSIEADATVSEESEGGRAAEALTSPALLSHPHTRPPGEEGDWKSKSKRDSRRFYNSDMPIPGPGAVIRAKRLRQRSTLSEETLWERLRDRRFFGLKFRRQVPIGPYVADFYCHERKLVLEIDGGIHDEDQQKAHDNNRDANLIALGYRVFRLTNDEVLLDLDSALRTIHQRLDRRQPG